MPACLEEGPHQRKVGNTKVTCATPLPWLFSVPVAAEDLPAVRYYGKRILTLGITSFTSEETEDQQGEGFAPVPRG